MIDVVLPILVVVIPPVVLMDALVRHIGADAMFIGRPWKSIVVRMYAGGNEKSSAHPFEDRVSRDEYPPARGERIDHRPNGVDGESRGESALSAPSIGPLPVGNHERPMVGKNRVIAIWTPWTVV